jgi:hypothetical protein
MAGDSGLSDIPALMIGQADGELLLDELNSDQIVNVVLDKSFFLTEADTGNNMGSFFSRGPGPIADILKPDVTAPGINILAGSTPDAVNAVSGEFFAFRTGTSMSTPHVAGVAALLKQAHPDWSPAAIKSALMTTAYQDVTLADGTTPAMPFDFGSGHIDPNKANDPGLIYDITADEYDAFACGVAPDMNVERCEELQTNGFSFEASDLNQPSVSVSQLIGTRTVTRRVTNVTDSTETYNAELELPSGIGVQVTPASLSLAPGQSATYDVTFTYQKGRFDLPEPQFGSLTWVSNDHSVRSVIAVRPLSISAPGDISAFGVSGNVPFPVEFGFTGIYTPSVHGLSLPFVEPDVFIREDPEKTFSRTKTFGVKEHIIEVPEGELFVRFSLFDALTDGNVCTPDNPDLECDDLDMYVYHCPFDPDPDLPFDPDLDCMFLDNYRKIGQSGNPTSEEQVDVLRPGGGFYAVYVHAFATDNVTGGPGAVYTLLAWSFGLDETNMTVSEPSFVNTGTTGEVSVDWDGLNQRTIYLGGISHNNPYGQEPPLTVIRVDTTGL